MAEYDGSIRIGTGIDTNGFDEDGKELEAKAKRLGKSLSNSAEIKVKVDASDTKKEFEEVFDDIEKEEKRIEELAKRAVERARKQQETVSTPQTTEESRLFTPGYNQDAIKHLEEYSGKADEVSKHFNFLKQNVEELSKKLMELQKEGKFFGDTDYDKIYVAWKNATDAIKDYRKELEKDTESGMAKAAEQEAKAAEKREAAQRKAEEREEKALQKENERIQKQIENEAKLAAKEAERQAKIQAEAAEEERLNQIRTNAVSVNDEIIAKVERIKQLEQEIADLKKAGITEGYQDYESRERELLSLKQDLSEYRDSLSEVPERFSRMRTAAQKAFGAIRSGFSAVEKMSKKAFSGILNTAKKAFSAITSGSKQSNASMSSGLKTILKYGLGIRSLYTLFSKIRSGIQQGFKNLMDYSGDFANSIQSVKNSMSTLGNQIAAAFAPIVQMVIPWLNQLISALSTAMSYVAQFIAALTGKGTFTKAKQVQDFYNKSLGGTATAAKKAYGALARFDDLDVLEKKEYTSGADSVEETLPKDMFEEIPVESRFEEFSRKAKEIFSQIFSPLKESWESQGEFVMNSWRYALEEIGLLTVSVGSDFLEIWNQPQTISMLENILIIVGDIGLIVGNLAGRFREAWEQNNIGLSILENIRNIFGIIVEHIRNAADFTVEWSKNLDFYPLLESVNGLLEALEPLADNVGAGLEWLWENVFLPLAGWTIEDAIPAALNAIGSALELISNVASTTAPHLQAIWDNFLKPVADIVGSSIVLFFEDLATAFDWISGNQALVDILGAVVAGIIAWEAAQWLLNIALNANPIGLIITAIGLLIIAVVEVVKHWDKISAKAKEVWEFVKEKFQEFIDWVSGVFETHWAALFGVLGGVFDEFFKMIGNIWDGIKKVFGGFITFLTGVFTGDWEKAWDGIVSIFESVKEIIDNIVGGIKNIISGVIDSIRNAIQAIKDFFSESSKMGSVSGAAGSAAATVSGNSGFSRMANASAMYSMADIPQLATGAVIRGGNPFMAILGDQPAGKTNIEAPASLIKDMVAQGIAEAGIGSRESIPVNINIIYDGETTARVMIPDILSELSRQGYNVDLLGYT